MSTNIIDLRSPGAVGINGRRLAPRRPSSGHGTKLVGEIHASTSLSPQEEVASNVPGGNTSLVPQGEVLINVPEGVIAAPTKKEKVKMTYSSVDFPRKKRKIFVERPLKRKSKVETVNGPNKRAKSGLEAVIAENDQYRFELKMPPKKRGKRYGCRERVEDRVEIPFRPKGVWQHLRVGEQLSASGSGSSSSSVWVDSIKGGEQPRNLGSESSFVSFIQSYTRLQTASIEEKLKAAPKGMLAKLLGTPVSEGSAENSEMVSEDGLVPGLEPVIELDSENLTRCSSLNSSSIHDEEMVIEKVAPKFALVLPVKGVPRRRVHPITTIMGRRAYNISDEDEADSEVSVPMTPGSQQRRPALNRAPYGGPVLNGLITPIKHKGIIDWQKEAELTFGKGSNQIRVRQGLKGAVKMVLTNVTSDTTARDVWTLIHARLDLAQAQQIKGVLKVLQPLRNPRFNLWVSEGIAGGLAQMLNLTYQDRRKAVPTLFSRSTKAPWKEGESKESCFSTKGWRLYLFKSWRDNDGPRPVVKPFTPPATKKNISLVAWNVNGYNFKASAAEGLARRTNAAVVILGEHLRKVTNYEPKMENYRTFSHPAYTGVKMANGMSAHFRGLAMMVREDIGAYEKNTGTPHVIHLVVTGLDSDSVHHVFGVYLQSGSNHGKMKRTQLMPLWDIINKLLDKDPDCKIAVGGDFNLTKKQLAKLAVKKTNGQMSIKPCTGSSLTRLPVKGTRNDIDHWLISTALLNDTTNVKVQREMAVSYNGKSDHAAIKLGLRTVKGPAAVNTDQKLVWDKKLLKGHSFGILTHNRWAAFDEDASLDDMHAQYHEIINAAAKDEGVLRPKKMGRKVHYPAAINRLLKKAREAKEQYLTVDKVTTRLDELVKRARRAEEASRRAEVAMKKFEKARKTRAQQTAIKMLRDNDMLEFHDTIKRALPDYLGKRKSQPIPCFNKQGKLCVSIEDINKAEHEHFSNLAKDETKVSQDATHWENLTCDDEKVACDFVGEKFTPLEFMATCSQLNKNAAPGVEKLPPNLAKEMLKHEREQFVAMLTKTCSDQPGLSKVVALKEWLSDTSEMEMEVFEDENGNITWKWEADELLVPMYYKKDVHTTEAGTFLMPMDHVYHPVPVEKIHNTLRTPAAKHALTVINKAFKEGRPAKGDTINTVISLNKPNKDPTLLTNRRGITLSTLFMKITMTMLERRLSGALNELAFFSKDQGGFRKGEEGIAQFLCLSEVVRRRANAGKKTYALYIDFQKAFPSVPHEALWKKLRHLKMPENVIKFLDQTYKDSRFCIKTGEILSDSYPMEIGTKEGCPLSPLLFIIFVNDLFKNLPGVRVPGMTDDKGDIYEDKGKLYADDAAAFFESIEDLERGLKIITKWVNKWQTLKIGHAKCAVVMYGEKDEKLRKQFLDQYGAPDGEREEQKFFSLTDGKVYAQSSYVYLGIPIGDSLGIGYEEERKYAITVAEKVRQKVGQFTCFLKDNEKSITEKVFLIKTYIMSAALYGGEWFGMNKERTNPIQSEINRAIKMALGMPRNSHDINMSKVSWELGIPTVEVACAKARYRIHAKSGALRTDAADILLAHKLEGRLKTWSTNTCAVTKKALIAMNAPPSDSENAFIPNRMAVRMVQLNDNKSNKPAQKGWVNITMDKNDPLTIKKERCDLQSYLWTKSLECPDKIGDNKAYLNGERGYTRNFKKVAHFYPADTSAILALTRARLGLFCKQEIAYRGDKEGNQLSNYAKDLGPLGCPLCRGRRDPVVYESELTHLLINCPALNEMRDEHLTETISQLKASCRDAENQDHQVAEYLLGGNCLPIAKSGEMLREYLGTLDRSQKFLYTWRVGWGHLTGFQPENMGTYGFVPVARFLKEALVKYQEGISKTYTAIGEGNNSSVVVNSHH